MRSRASAPRARSPCSPAPGRSRPTGRDVIHLEIGEPDFETPPHVAEAGIAAIRAGETHYCQTAGLPVLREAAAASLAASRGVADRPGARPRRERRQAVPLLHRARDVRPRRRGRLPGSRASRSTSRPCGSPGRPPCRCRSARSEASASTRSSSSSSLSERTRLVILNAPQNPTGGVIPRADLERAAAAIERTPAWVLTDEVYSRITYDVEAPSIASLPGMLERTILLDGFSKTFAMTGWRLGYAAVPDELVDPLTRLIVNSTSCVPPFVQLAGVAALEGPQDAVDEMVAEFRRRRDFLVPALNAIPGISCIEPGGAFYAFPNVSALPIDADELADRLLDEAGVALLAGSAFGAPRDRSPAHLVRLVAREPRAGGRPHRRVRRRRSSQTRAGSAALLSSDAGLRRRPLPRRPVR